MGYNNEGWRQTRSAIVNVLGVVDYFHKKLLKKQDVTTIWDALRISTILTI